jgi:hypothetical protein
MTAPCTKSLNWLGHPNDVIGFWQSVLDPIVYPETKHQRQCRSSTLPKAVFVSAYWRANGVYIAMSSRTIQEMSESAFSFVVPILDHLPLTQNPNEYCTDRSVIIIEVEARGR